MAFQDKVETTETLETLLRESMGTVVVDYRGLNVADISALRRKLREQDVELRVAKNTLLRRAAASTNLVNVDDLFIGPTAVATSATDEVAAARLISEAARVPRTPLSIKGGIYGLHGVGPDLIKVIAELPGRGIMLARAVGAAQAPASAALSIIQASARQVLNAVSALQKQKETAAA
jgi:large subunit ribosomal protein L10